VEGDILMSLLLKILEKRNNTQKLGKEAEMKKVGGNKEWEEDGDESTDEGDNKKLKEKDKPEPPWKSYPPFIDDRNKLFVVIMSATINVKSFSDYFNDAPVIEIEGKSFEVEHMYLPETLRFLYETISFVPKPKGDDSPDSCDEVCYYFLFFLLLLLYLIYLGFSNSG
jgi:hypothetical protein